MQYESPTAESLRQIYDVCPDCKHKRHYTGCKAIYNTIIEGVLAPVTSKCLCATINLDAANSEGTKSYRVPIAWRFDLIPPVFLRRLAAIFEEGAHKYGENTYLEKPLPFSVIMNHLMNHLLLYWSGDRSEDHLAKVAWGVAAMMAQEETGKADNDLRRYGVRIGKDA